MALSTSTQNQIRDILTTTIRNKLKNYSPETKYMPFHWRLLGRDRYAMFSFVHSMNTKFGMSIWEQVAVALAQGAGHHSERQYKLLGQIDTNTEKLISELHFQLRKGEITAGVEKELRLIKDHIQPGSGIEDPDSTVDLFIRIDQQENFFDITSAKPNMKEFAALKLKLLRWIALRLSQNKDAYVITRLAIPYNPYHPEPYERWTLTGLYDLRAGEILVGEEFWNFVASDDIYENLLDIFQDVGEKLRGEIDDKFASFKTLSD
jgi:hypothetical protein